MKMDKKLLAYCNHIAMLNNASKPCLPPKASNRLISRSLMFPRRLVLHSALHRRLTYRSTLYASSTQEITFEKARWVTTNKHRRQKWTFIELPLKIDIFEFTVQRRLIHADKRPLLNEYSLTKFSFLRQWRVGSSNPKLSLVCRPSPRCI